MKFLLGLLIVGFLAVASAEASQYPNYKNNECLHNHITMHYLSNKLNAMEVSEKMIDPFEFIVVSAEFLQKNCMNDKAVDKETRKAIPEIIKESKETLEILYRMYGKQR